MQCCTIHRSNYEKINLLHEQGNNENCIETCGIIVGLHQKKKLFNKSWEKRESNKSFIEFQIISKLFEAIFDY